LAWVLVWGTFLSSFFIFKKKKKKKKKKTGRHTLTQKINQDIQESRLGFYSG